MKTICLNSKMGRGGQEGLQPSIQDRIYSTEGKSTAVTTAFITNIAEPVAPPKWNFSQVFAKEF